MLRGTNWSTGLKSSSNRPTSSRCGSLQQSLAKYNCLDSVQSVVLARHSSLIPYHHQLGFCTRPSQDNSISFMRRENMKVYSSGAQPISGNQEEPSGGNGSVMWLAVAVLIGGAAFAASTPFGQVLKESLINGPLGKSGFFAAFSLIFVSEIGDKTFFIAALLAMKLGRWISFLGSVSSLAIMTIISVTIGVIFSKVPDALKSSIPVGELAGVALLLFFGIKALKDGLQVEEGTQGKSDEEMAGAEDVVKQAETSGRLSSPVTSFFEVATLIFIAEWGDRSMLATIALGAAQNPYGVAAGAIAGHAIATGIAVMGGAIASKYISEKTVNLISGLLFIVFAIATGISML